MFSRRSDLLSTASSRPLFAPDGAEGGAPDAAADAATAAAAGTDTPAGDAATGGGAGDVADGDASPGDDAAGEGEGAADEADAASGDAAAAEVAPFEGLTPPEGFASLDAEALAAATPILRGLGVETTEAAQKAVNEFAPIISGLVEKAVLANAEQAKTAQADLAASWANEVKADPALGGANYERVTAENAVVLDTFFTPEFREYLDVTGLGNHPEMVRGLHKISSQIETGTIHLGGASKKELAPHQKIYDPVYDGPQTPTN